MPVGRPKPRLIISPSKRKRLEAWSRRRKTAQALALRSRIVLRCASRMQNIDVAEQLGVSKQMVGKWRQRFIDRRIDGLLDEPRPGAPRKITDADVERVIVQTLETRPRDATHWSVRSMAKQSGISRTTVHRIWRAFSLQPHRSETFKLSKDPLFVEKMRDIVGHATTSLFAALDVATHKAPAIRRWLAKRPRFHVHFTPTSATWINLVERGFATWTAKQIRRGTFRSTFQLEAKIKDYIEVCHEDPKPFVWMKTADGILDSIARFCLRTSGTGHERRRKKWGA